MPRCQPIQDAIYVRYVASQAHVLFQGEQGLCIRHATFFPIELCTYVQYIGPKCNSRLAPVPPRSLQIQSDINPAHRTLLACKPPGISTDAGEPVFVASIGTKHCGRGQTRADEGRRGQTRADEGRRGQTYRIHPGPRQQEIQKQMWE